MPFVVYDQRRPHKPAVILRITLIIIAFLTAYFGSQRAYVKINKSLLIRTSSYDVIVVGSDPEGIAAAVSSARNGMSTLLIDKRDRLGGLWTVGGLNVIDMNDDPVKGLVTRGIFEEFYNANNRNDAFDLDDAQAIFESMVAREAKLVVRLQTPVTGVAMSGHKIAGVFIKDRGKKTLLKAKRIIDATQDADIAARAGVPYYIGMEDINLPKDHQPMTLVFKLGNVNWSHLREHSEMLRILQFGGATETSAWGYYDQMQQYHNIHQNIKMRGLNIGRQDKKFALINSMQILGVDPLSDAAKARARLKAIDELPSLTLYIDKHIPGFGNAYLAGAMPELYVRESRHIVGYYRLTVNDVLENRDFPDKIALGSYPVDIQRTFTFNKGIVLGKPRIYSIPFRCIVPRRVENLLVVGRSASFDSLGHGSARTVPVGMATGQAAGVACAYSINENIPFRKMIGNPVIGRIQDTLRDQGAYLINLRFRYPYQGHWALESIRFLRKVGVVDGGYSNNYSLGMPVSSTAALNMALETEKRHFIRRRTQPPDVFQASIMNEDQAAKLLLYLAGRDYQVLRPIRRAVQLDILTESTAQRSAISPRLTRAIWLTMLTDFIHYRMKTGLKSKPYGPHIM